jgi:hypothetical protein
MRATAPWRKKTTSLMFAMILAQFPAGPGAQIQLKSLNALVRAWLEFRVATLSTQLNVPVLSVLTSSQLLDRRCVPPLNYLKRLSVHVGFD